MGLDRRISKVAAHRASVRKVAVAYARRAEGESLSDMERVQAQEFEATIEAMFLMAAVDGQVAGDEKAQLAASLQAILDTRGRRETVDIDRTLQDLSGKLEREGWIARLDTVAKRLTTEEARSFAFRLAAAVAFVDDHVAHAEAAAIDALSHALKLTNEASQQILQEVQEMLFQE